MPGRRRTPNTTELFSSSSNSPVIVTLPKLNRTRADFLRSGFCCKELRLLTWVHKEPDRGWKLDLWPLFYVWCLLYVVCKPETDDCPLSFAFPLESSGIQDGRTLMTDTFLPQRRAIIPDQEASGEACFGAGPCRKQTSPFIQRLQYQCSITDQTGPWPELCIYAFLLPRLQFFLHLNIATLKIRFRVICSSPQCGHTNEFFSASRHDLGL